jgi:hypothetical protein
MSDRKTPDLFVEQMLLAERTAEPQDAARLAELAQSNAEILKRYPPRVVALRVRGVRQRSVRQWAVGGSLVLAAAALTIAVIPASVSHPSLQQVDPNDGFRDKGDPTLHIHRVTTAGAEVLGPEASAHEGDRLQLSYLAAGERYGVVLSVDGRGSVTMHLPLSGSVAAPLSPDGDTILGSSYALDDAPAFERFFLVTSDAPFALSAVTSAAKQLAQSGDPESAPLSLPSSLHQTSFLVLKR